MMRSTGSNNVSDQLNDADMLRDFLEGIAAKSALP